MSDDKNISTFGLLKHDSEPSKRDSLLKIEYLIKGFGFMMNDEIKPKLVTRLTFADHSDSAGAREMNITEWSRQQSDAMDDRRIQYFRLSDMEMPGQATNETDFDSSISNLPESTQNKSLILANNIAGSGFIQGFMGIPVHNLKFRSTFRDKEKLPKPKEIFYKDAKIVIVPLSKSIGRKVTQALLDFVKVFKRHPHDSTGETIISLNRLSAIQPKYDTLSDEHIEELESKNWLEDLLFEIDCKRYNPLLQIDEVIIQDYQSEEHSSSDKNNVDETDSKISRIDQFFDIDSRPYKSWLEIDEEKLTSNIPQDVAQNGKDNKQPDIAQMITAPKGYEIVDPWNIVNSGVNFFGEPTKIYSMENYKDWKPYGEGEIEIWAKPGPIVSYYLLLWDSASNELLIHMKLTANLKIEYFPNRKDTCRWMNYNYANSPKGKLELLSCRFQETKSAEQFMLLVCDCVKQLWPAF
ncbi:uncharacterized protein Sprn [Drosophila tropicalis]|uniref:uncharacterized protein Sprn n=1 Tax=Drosophila tropicalis TaxID=46794 RepID=UPI0035ABDFAE